MNYQQEYNSFYTDYYSLIERKIKHFLITEKTKKKNVDIVLNQLNQYLFSNVPKLLNVIENIDLKNLLQLFEKRNNLYEEDQINLILSNEIRTSFDAIPIEQLPVNYTFDKLLKEIAIQSAVEDITHLLNKNRNLFVLFYRLNDFSKFEIKEYKGISIEDTPLFIELNTIANPEHYTNPDIGIDDLLVEDEKEKKYVYSLPLAIATLIEIGFFELPHVKNLSPTGLMRLVAIIQAKDPKNSTVKRAITGNLNILKDYSKEDGTRYTSHKHAETVKEILKQIK